MFGWLMLASGSAEEHVLPHRYFDLLPFNVGNWLHWDSIWLLNIDFGPKTFQFTNHLIMAVVAAVLCYLLFPWVARQYARNGGTPAAPRGAVNLVEAVLEALRRDIVRPVLKERTDQYMPFLWTLFFFILFCNLLGMIPLDSIFYLLTGGSVAHLGGTATANMGITGGLAICAFLMIHASGTREVYRQLVAGTYGHHGHDDEHHAEPRGHEHHAGHDAHGGHAHPSHRMPPAQAAILAFPLYVWNFAPHVFKPPPGTGPVASAVLTVADVLMWLVLLLLELLGAVIKPFVLMVRLFANMVAGHLVLATILGLITAASGWMYWVVGLSAGLGCVALSCLELFVAFLQAYIFMFLTTLFLSMSVAPEH